MSDEKYILATKEIGSSSTDACGRYDDCGSDCGYDSCSDCKDEQCGSDCSHD